MRIWPRKAEQRSAATATATEGHLPRLPELTTGGDSAAQQIAERLYGDCFAQLEYRLPAQWRGSISPQTSAVVGRALARQGEALLMLSLDNDAGPAWVPVGSWTVWGSDPHPAKWTYEVTVAAPSNTANRRLPSDAVLHVVHNARPHTPWRGRPLWANSASSGLAATLERRLAEESAVGVGYLLSVGEALTDDQRQRLGERWLAGSGSGHTVIAATGGMAPTHTRIGPSFDQAAIELRRAVNIDVLAALGIPAALVYAESDGAQREAWRRFQHASLAPLGNALEAELRRKVDDSARLSWDKLFAADIAARSRAVGSLVTAGMSLSEALSVAQIEA